MMKRKRKERGLSLGEALDRIVEENPKHPLAKAWVEYQKAQAQAALTLGDLIELERRRKEKT